MNQPPKKPTAPNAFDAAWNTPATPTPSTAPHDAFDAAWNADSATPARPGFLDRLGSAVGHAVAHPIDTAAGMLAAPVQSFMRTFDTPTEGDEVTTAQRLRGKAGPTAASTRLPVGTIISKANTPGAQSRRDQLTAAAQTVANVAAPGVFKGIGAVAPALGTWGTRAATAAAGAGMGALQSPDDPAVGATLGAALPSAVEGAARVGGNVAARIGAGRATRGALLDAAPAGAPLRAVREAARVLGDAYQADNVTPDHLRAAIPAAPADAILLDTGGPAVRAQAQVAASTPRSHGPQRFTDVLNARLRNEAPALQSAAERAAGQPAPTRATHLQQYDAQTQQITGPLYERAFAEAAQTHPQGFAHPTLDELASTPTGQEGWQMALRDAADQRRPLPQRLVINPDGTGRFEQQPDLRAIQIWKMAMQRVVDRNLERGSISAETARNVQGLVSDLNDHLRQDDVAPAYKAADDAHAARMRGREAFESGYQYPSQDADALAIQRQGLPAGTDPQYQLGALARTRKTLRSTQDTRPAAARIAGSDEMRAQLRAVYPDAVPLLDEAQRWTDRRTQATEVLRGSQTAPRLEARRTFNAGGDVPMEDIANALTRLRPFTALRHAADRVTGGYFENRRLNANAARANVLTDWLTREIQGTSTSIGTNVDPQSSALLRALELTGPRPPQRMLPSYGTSSPLRNALVLGEQRDQQQP